MLYTNEFLIRVRSRALSILLEHNCYKSPKKEQVSHVFKHLIANIKSYNVDKI